MVVDIRNLQAPRGSNDTVYKWINTHEMPEHRMSRLGQFKKTQVDAWIESGGAAEPGSGTGRP